ncbi:MAG: acylphosphatase [bacterium]
MSVRLEIRVRGRVQGVAYRWHTLQQAQRLGVTGTVRNRPDGSVRIVAEGNREALEALLIWARQGPPHALVSDTEVVWSEARGEFAEFDVRG